MKRPTPAELNAQAKAFWDDYDREVREHLDSYRGQVRHGKRVNPALARWAEDPTIDVLTVLILHAAINRANPQRAAADVRRKIGKRQAILAAAEKLTPDLSDAQRWARIPWLAEKISGVDRHGLQAGRAMVAVSNDHVRKTLGKSYRGTMRPAVKKNRR